MHLKVEINDKAGIATVHAYIHGLYIPEIVTLGQAIDLAQQLGQSRLFIKHFSECSRIGITEVIKLRIG